MFRSAHTLLLLDHIVVVGLLGPAGLYSNPAGSFHGRRRPKAEVRRGTPV